MIRNQTFQAENAPDRNFHFESRLLTYKAEPDQSAHVQGVFVRAAQLRHIFIAASTATALAFLAVPADAQPRAISDATDADPGTFGQLAQGYLQQRADSLTTSPPTLRSAMSRIKTTRTMATQTQDDLAALAEKGRRYTEVDGGYTKAEVDVKVTDMTVTEQTANVQVNEHTRLYLPFTQQEIEEGAPEYEESSLPHTVKFTKGTDGAWLLSSDKVENEGGPTPTTQVSDTETPEQVDDGAGSPDEEEGDKEAGANTDPLPGATPDDVKPTASADYNFNKMVAYANKYWNNHNDDYRSYGNDCTNFISQAMYAGGWGPKGGALYQRTSNKYWFYGPTKFLTSYTWAGAENWYFFAKKHSKRTKALNNVWKLLKSDVLQADWDRNNNINHTMIVTKKYRGTPYLTYHSSDTHNKSLKKLLSDHPRAWWYAHRT
ncbi:amidase domain-containing protein [Streptomyces sp. NPDC058268]|uniref:amidase domain-containing protein n=1 Tax=Streptomyces sp. NPDC058268 TaxID=3346413 RepID=UPI0036EA6FE9